MESKNKFYRFDLVLILKLYNKEYKYTAAKAKTINGPHSGNPSLVKQKA